MPITPHQTVINTHEERMAKIIEIINKMPNSFERQLLLNFVFDIIQRYIQKSRELERFVNPKMEELDRRFMEMVAKELGFLV